MRLSPKYSRYVVAGSASGTVWFILALAFDKGVRDFNYPVMPTNTVFATVACAIGAMLTGIFIMVLFGRFIMSKSKRVFFTAPLATLPIAIGIFSILIWCVWLLVGERASTSASSQLSTILNFYLAYGTISIFAPFLYGMCLVNQYVVRALIMRTT